MSVEALAMHSFQATIRTAEAHAIEIGHVGHRRSPSVAVGAAGQPLVGIGDSDMREETLVTHTFPARIAQRKLMRLKNVLEATGLTRSTLYRKIANETFPRPVHIGDRAVAWRESDVVRWMDEQEAKWDK